MNQYIVRIVYSSVLEIKMGGKNPQEAENTAILAASLPQYDKEILENMIIERIGIRKL